MQKFVLFYIKNKTIDNYFLFWEDKQNRINSRHKEDIRIL
jgi:hypothetical protein